MVQEGVNVWDGPQTDRNSPKRQPIKVVPPTSSGHKKWAALGYEVNATTKKAAAKKIHKLLIDDCCEIYRISDIILRLELI